MSAATAAAAIAENFRKYLIACEYLQIDPAKIYDVDFIRKRIETVRIQWDKTYEYNQIKKLNKILKWFEKNYVRLVKRGFFGYNFANKCEKLVSKGKLILHEGSVRETYVRGDLSQTNYDYYSRNDKKIALIVIAVFLIFILLIVLLSS
jgi:hypothetical protein